MEIFFSGYCVTKITVCNHKPFLPKKTCIGLLLVLAGAVLSQLHDVPQRNMECSGGN